MMFRDAWAWCVEHYAAHVWALVEEQRETLSQGGSIYQAAIQEMGQASRDAEKVLSMRAGEIRTFPIITFRGPAAERRVLVVRRESPDQFRYREANSTRGVGGDRFWKKSYTYEASGIVRNIQDRMRFYSNSARKAEVRENASMGREVSTTSPEEIKALIQALRRYTTAPSLTKTSLSTSIPYNLSGWKYTANIPQAEAVRKLKDHWGKPGLDLTMLFKRLQGRAGGWRPESGRLDVVIPYREVVTVKDLGAAIETLTQSLEHEMIHFGQTAMQIVTDASEVRGLPSRKVRDPQYDPDGVIPSTRGTPLGERLRQQHSLQDVEFYTNLNNEVRKFTELVWTGVIPQDRIREAIAIWTNEKNGSFDGKFRAADSFRHLKSYQKDKWRIAVREFVKALRQRGVQVK